MFYKIDCSGNTFIVIRDREDFDVTSYRSILEDVDGLIILCPSKSATANFIIYNKDGSRAKMCGNGLIAATIFFKEIMNSEELDFRFLTDGGYYRTKANEDGTYSVYFDKPKIIFSSSTTGMVDSKNMHLIKIVDSINPSSMIDMQKVLDGPINIHELQKSIDDVYLMVSLENGVGFTKSCGTGCISCFAYLRHLNCCGTRVLFKTMGGMIEVKEEDNEYVLRGSGKIVYSGELYNE